MATRRTARPSEGKTVAALALRQGWALMPWQSLVLDTALEVRADGTPAYRTIVVTVPRQNGKTLMLWALMLWRSLMFEDNMIIATAQSGIEAMEKWRDYVGAVEEGSFADRIVEVRRANGSEVIAWNTGTRHRVRAPTARAGHGVTLDLGIIDEAWALPDEVVLQSMRPAMVTRRHAQLWIVSTAGTIESVMLRRHVEQGRRAVADGATEGFAYFEWSAPEEAPADDPATWRACMPAMGYTITPEVIAADRETMAPGEFERAYLNRWTDATETVIPMHSWLNVLDEKATPGGLLWFGADATPERDAAAIVVAGRHDGKIACEVIDHRAGVDWLVPRLDELRRKHRANVVLDGTGPAASFAEDLAEAPTLLTYRMMQHASASMFDAITYGTVVFRPHPGLNLAIRGAAKFGSGDLWRWGRKRSISDVSPLVAATVAHHQSRSERGGSLRIF